ncbi:MAG: glycosyltransferase [Elusimicrobiota bacterium]
MATWREMLRTHRPIQEVHISPLPLMRFKDVLDHEAWDELIGAFRDTGKVFGRRTIWNINSTGTGGGVVEILQAILPYLRGAGVDARWLVITAKKPFFHVTKRLHNMMQGEPGDGGELGPEERGTYDDTMDFNARMLAAVVQPGDLVVLHDPQTAGLAAFMKKRGAKVIWRCHIGTDKPNEFSRRGWEFLLPYVTSADAYIFSCLDFVPAGIDRSRVDVVMPSIDVFSSKNQHLDPAVVRGILHHTGLVSGKLPKGSFPIFRRLDDTPSRVDRQADIVREGPPPDFEEPLIVQVSRWDRLKDPKGVLAGFAEHAAGRCDAHLLLAAPDASSILDDPEAAQALGETLRLLKRLPVKVRKRVHLASLPMADLEENAAIVNAIQRHGTVLVQKSLKEGFGLTIAEAMWKARPVVATAVGGVKRQVQNWVDGILLDDPTDLDAFGGALVRLLEDEGLAERLGRKAKQRAQRSFLNDRHMVHYMGVLKRVA